MSARLIEFRGELKTMNQWADYRGISVSLLRQRIDHWGMDRAMDTPPLRMKTVEQLHQERIAKGKAIAARQKANRHSRGLHTVRGAKELGAKLGLDRHEAMDVLGGALEKLRIGLDLIEVLGSDHAEEVLVDLRGAPVEVYRRLLVRAKLLYPAR